MDKKALREYTHKADNFLTIGNIVYKQWVFRYTFLELEKDLGIYGDITTNALFDDNKRISASIIAKEEGILCGIAEIRYFLVESEKEFKPRLKSDFRIDFKMEDGSRVGNGDVIMQISADIHDLLAVERTVLNLLGRMSGVATFTRKIVDMVKAAGLDVLIAPTRKTLWGLLDKKAVLLGGGGTHRLNLGDAILVKDTHLDACERNFAEVIKKIADSGNEMRFAEIEVENVAEVLEVSKRLCAMMDAGFDIVGAVLMDNMSASDVSSATSEVKKAGYFERVLYEASGGINEDNVIEYAGAGVDIISMGCLTNGVKSLDLSMKVGK
ncbi:carboxylating nicotinate-nucleotide diphosphorylase [Candidatus Peregrinibacteria bacterium]|nr:carboxylating nicotinate-nucleotide diphosphorylase [Candidatus Peregrinibacteria bacterium]